MLVLLNCMQRLVLLKASYNKNIKRLDEGLAELRSSIAMKDKTISHLMKDKKALEGELQVAEDKFQQEIQAATTQAKIWAPKSVRQARIMMAMEAAEAGFEKAE